MSFECGWVELGFWGVAFMNFTSVGFRHAFESLDSLVLFGLQKAVRPQNRGDTYIQHISLSEGSCDGAVPEVNDTARRLQSAVRTDYVVVFPAALGVEAGGGSHRRRLSR